MTSNLKKMRTLKSFQEATPTNTTLKVIYLSSVTFCFVHLKASSCNVYFLTEMNQRGAGLKELLPPTTNEKPKHKHRRKPGSSGNVASSEEPVKHSSRHSRSKHGSMDSSSSDQEPSVRRRRSGEGSTNPFPDGSAPPRKGKPRKHKGSIGGEGSVRRSSKGKPDTES